MFAVRLERLMRIRAAVADEKERGVEPNILPGLHAFYRYNPAQFIDDWGITFDPRNVQRGQPALMPFVLFPKQREFLEWFFDCWRTEERGWCPKSREVGISWLCVGAAATLAMFNDNFVAGFGSRKEEYVDKRASPKSLFYKARLFVQNAPWEFRGLWRPDRDAPHMRVSCPLTGSVLVGEAGNSIGRGDRTSIYVVDEAAWLENGLEIEASLSNTTRCRIDVSSVRNTAEPFWQGLIKAKPSRVFWFRWTDDPRKSVAWREKMIAEYGATVVAQEVDINPNASTEGIVIPQDWVESAVDAHRKLGIVPSGRRRGVLDVADQGNDANAFGVAYGVVVEHVEEWTGKQSDIFETTERGFTLADRFGLESFDYDGDGLGAGVRGDARVINERRKAEGKPELSVSAFRGSGAVVSPDDPIPSAGVADDGPAIGADYDPTQKIIIRTNKDYFANLKAQSWFSLRVRFQITHRAVRDGAKFNPDDIISLPAELPNLDLLKMQLSQVCFGRPTATGKMVIDKMPDGAKSPNMADDVMMLFAPQELRPAGIFDL